MIVVSLHKGDKWLHVELAKATSVETWLLVLQDSKADKNIRNALIQQSYKV